MMGLFGIHNFLHSTHVDCVPYLTVKPLHRNWDRNETTGTGVGQGKDRETEIGDHVTKVYKEIKKFKRFVNKLWMNQIRNVSQYMIRWTTFRLRSY